ncbi:MULTISPECIES: ATP-binding cassette domain-containing protein [Methanosarcina]|uniref:Dipeptide transport ATP-binding protein DppF n=3 Tax=Methanosarcina barkeri TaxID=2208 RepID=A0A0E3LNW3_METBA|nr:MULTISPECIES: dipeptide/oligopeptide/nickel ABC transporter ATP-binding protein [Methanosarcina]AKB55471.1 Dipeptide transport ATP-binding protein DppF [Methanosarcina barkeri MS]AKB58960.1 Dipeptide transport ATP-binding protein DppF [Methanosarcina barkeri 227]AKJ38637.1 dipeptide/oligopeptide/nickel ABC transporter ATP-binding protein [Methanosarcina barkeri CM1]OEC89599.1 dipeptide/oligopeptide/nickel ABC transporter ATP-binding protein [Methanosarcina sp. A14]
MALLEVKNLKKHYYSGLFQIQVNKAVDGVSFRIEKGKTLGLVGKSGCGKSTLGRTVLRLLEPTEGSIIFDGQDISGLKDHSLKYLGTRMQIIFQNPKSCLNPKMKVYDIIAEPLRLHRLCAKDEELERVKELIEIVSLNEELLFRYPKELSGGQLQRVAIARVLSMKPELIVADEPTSMLDPLVQAQILSLLKGLQIKFKISFLFISHDIKVVEWMSDEIAFMEKGKIVNFKIVSR